MEDENLDIEQQETNNLVSRAGNTVSNFGRGVASGINSGFKSAKSSIDNKSNIPDPKNQNNSNQELPSAEQNKGNGLEDKNDPLNKKDNNKKDKNNKSTGMENKSSGESKDSSISKKSNEEKKHNVLDRFKEKRNGLAGKSNEEKVGKRIINFFLQHPYFIVIGLMIFLILIFFALLLPMSTGLVAVKNPGSLCVLRNPVAGDVISGYTWRIRDDVAEAHKGIDVATDKGRAVYSIASGTISDMGYNSEYGYYVVVDHGTIEEENTKSLYANLLDDNEIVNMDLLTLDISVGSSVMKGQRIGYVGDSSESEDGIHLHFELFERGKNVSPNRMYDYDDPIGSCDPTESLDTTKEEIENLKCETLIELKEEDRIEDYCDNCETPFTIRYEKPELYSAFYDWDNSYQCPWYTRNRANEILSEIGSDKVWTYAGDAYSFCDNTGEFESGLVPKSGSIFVWFGGSSVCPSGPGGHCGHVGIVEQVNSDGTILISSGWNNTGIYWNRDTYTFRTETVNETWSNYTVGCYIYLIDDEACRNSAVGESVVVNELINIDDKGSPDLVPTEIIEYKGADFNPDVLQAYKKMESAAAEDGITFEINNSFRNPLNASVDPKNAEGGYEPPYDTAGRYMSEHHYGLAIDFDPCCYGFEGKVPQTYNWLRMHAQEYGFIQRYTSINVGITQYVGETWHWRYIGVQHAKKYYAEGWKSYEEYYCKRINDQKNTCKKYNWHLNDARG